MQTLVVWGGSRGPPHCLCFGFGCDLFVMLGWSAAPAPRTYMLGRCCTREPHLVGKPEKETILENVSLCR